MSSDIAKRLLDRIAQKSQINSAFQDATIFGSGVMKSEVYSDGTWVVYPVDPWGDRRFWQSYHEHGQGD